MDLANRCKVEDIENFASVFYIAKRSGGDMGNVILKVSRMLGDKIDVKKEIEATLSAKKIRADDHESDASWDYIVPGTGFPWIFECSLWKSLWNLCNDGMFSCLCRSLLAGKKDRRY